MEQRRRPTTETNEEDISTAVPNTFPQPTKSPMTIGDKVDDMHDSLKTGQGCKLAVAPTQKATRNPKFLWALVADIAMPANQSCSTSARALLNQPDFYYLL